MSRPPIKDRSNSHHHPLSSSSPSTSRGHDHDRDREKTKTSSPRLYSTSYPPSPPSAFLTTIRIRFASSRSLKLLILLCTTLLLVFILHSIFPSSTSSKHIRIPPSPLGLSASEARKLSKPKIDESGDPEPFRVEDFQRSFEEPDFALLSGKQPNEIGCEIGIDWKGRDGAGPVSRVGGEEDDGVLVFLGVFSAADKKRRRDL